MAPLFEQKQKLWTLAALDSNSTISLTLTEPLPNDVLQYLRIQRLHESDIAEMGSRLRNVGQRKISDSNEVEILKFLVESFSALLDSFSVGAETLEEQLAGELYARGENSWSAAHVSLGEQRLLRLAKKKAEALLAIAEGEKGNQRATSSMPTQCANCGKVQAQLMRCGRCNGVAYCGRACQVAHYKVHKAQCRATAVK
jgi:hypothetical protein